MSYSPQKVQAQLQHEIEKRISHDSPTKYDIDFYLRKITRLEDDLNLVQDQLSRARVRLRRAEDFQIKYDLLLKQNSNLLSDLEKREKQFCDLRSQNQFMKVQIHEKQSKGEDWSSQKLNLHNEIEKWKSKFEEAQERRTSQINGLREKQEANLKKAYDSVKKQFAQKEDQYQQQIRQLKKIVHEKETVENVVTGRVEQVRQEKDQEINRLGKLLQRQKDQHTAIVQQKNEEFDKLRQKFEKMFNFELQNLKKNLDDQDQIFSIEMNGLREMLGLKNDEINKLLKELKEQTHSYEEQRQYLIQQSTMLKNKIYAIQRDDEMQLYNVKQRLTKIHSLDIQALQKRYSDLVNNLKGDKAQLQAILKEKEKIMEAQKDELSRVKEELLDRLKEREARITELLGRIKDSGDMNEKEMKNLHQSFHQIQTEKETMVNQYQANISFLNQQIAKLTNANDLKNNEIKQLQEEIGHIRKINAENIRDLEQNWREQRRQREEEKEREKEKRQKMFDEIRIKEREWKNKERHLQRQREKEQREKNKFIHICEQLQRDSERLNKQIKQLDENLKKEMKKNQLSMIDNGGVRRQLGAQLQRQKSQLQAIKRMEVDNIKKKFQIQITRLTNKNEKLETDLVNKSNSYESLEDEFKKLEYVNKNIDRINKEKLIEYQKKMATLNSQINLTQNLYQSFLEAKAREQKKK